MYEVTQEGIVSIYLFSHLEVLAKRYLDELAALRVLRVICFNLVSLHARHLERSQAKRSTYSTNPILLLGCNGAELTLLALTQPT
jgi:hypothetical protein